MSVRKAINFDLDTKALKQHYCQTNNPLEYLNAYKEIKKFMINHGFSHRQWSGYVSEKAMSKAEIKLLITDLTQNFPWFSHCVNKIDETNVGKQYDLMDIVMEAAETLEKASEKPLINVSEETKSTQDNVSSGKIEKESENKTKDTITGVGKETEKPKAFKPLKLSDLRHEVKKTKQHEPKKEHNSHEHNKGQTR